MAWPDAIVREDEGVLRGLPRRALMASKQAVHDPEIARRHGLRGGVVGGSRHLNVFAPLMLSLWGQAAFERGGVSIYFEGGVLEGEMVQAFVRRPPQEGALAEAWLRRGDPGAASVGRGTLTLGAHESGELHRRDLRLCDVSHVRILKAFAPGKRICEAAYAMTSAAQLEQLQSGEINEPLHWYFERSPWGEPIAAISPSFQVPFNPTKAALKEHTVGVTPMGGAVEIAYRNGPIFLDRPYRIVATSLGVGQSPKTEYLVIDFTVADEAGRPVATARQLMRFMKAGSPQYPEAPLGAVSAAASA